MHRAFYSLPISVKALYWYLRATGPDQSVTEVIERSGLSRAAVYRAIQNHPDWFDYRTSTSTVQLGTAAAPDSLSAS